MLLNITGAQIIDLMLLVVDITKGIQTQTAEVSVLVAIEVSHWVIGNVMAGQCHMLVNTNVRSFQ